MGARAKVNAAYTAGAVVLAGTVGAAAGSWGVFGAALAVALGLAVAGGHVRPTGRG